MLTEMKRFASNLLVKNHPILAPFLRDRHAVYRSAGGRIYLNLKESPMMLARALDVYEQYKMAAVRWFLKPGMTFIDVGCNKGDFALLAARITGESGTVLCFEPESENCRWIRKSIELNGYENVTLHEVALSNQNGTAQLHLGRKSGSHTLLDGQEGRDAGTVIVRTATLDSILESLSLKTVDVMKIDVEGAELQVLDGARKLLSCNSHITLLVDIHPKMGVKPQQVCDLLTGIGFSVCTMKPPFDKPAELREDSREMIARK